MHGSLFHFQRLEGADRRTRRTASRSRISIASSSAARSAARWSRTRRSSSSRSKASARTCRGRIWRSRSARRARSAAPTLGANEALINGSADCQRLALLNFFQARRGQDEGLPVEHPINNNALLAKLDWNLSPRTTCRSSYNFDYSKNDEPDLRRRDLRQLRPTAPKGPSKINVLNLNLFTHASPPTS